MTSQKEMRPTSETDIPKRLTFLDQVYDILKPFSEGEKKEVFIAGSLILNIGEQDVTLVISPTNPKSDISALNKFANDKFPYFSKPYDENSPFSLMHARAFDKKGGIRFLKIVYDKEAIGTEEINIPDETGQVTTVKKISIRNSTTVIICPSQQIAELSFLALAGEFDQIPKKLKASDELAYGITEKQLKSLRKMKPL